MRIRNRGRAVLCFTVPALIPCAQLVGQAPRPPIEVPAAPQPGVVYGFVRDAIAVPDRGWVAAALDDGSVRFWNTATRRPVESLRISMDTMVNVLTASRDGRIIGSVSQSGRYTLWHVVANDGAPTLHEQSSVEPAVASDDPAEGLTFSPDVRMLAIAHRNRLALLHLDSMVQVPLLDSRVEYPSDLRFSEDGRWLGAKTSDHVTVWEVGTGKRVGRFREPARVTDGFCYAITDSGRLVMYSQRNGAVYTWELATGRRRDGPTLEPKPGRATGPLEALLALDGAGRRLAIATDQGLELWDVANGRLVQRLKTEEPVIPNERVSSLAFSPDERSLLVRYHSFAREGVVRVWDLTTAGAATFLPSAEVQLEIDSVTRTTTPPEGLFQQPAAGESRPYLLAFASLTNFSRDDQPVRDAILTGIGSEHIESVDVLWEEKQRAVSFFRTAWAAAPGGTRTRTEAKVGNGLLVTMWDFAVPTRNSAVDTIRTAQGVTLLAGQTAKVTYVFRLPREQAIEPQLNVRLQRGVVGVPLVRPR